MPRVPSRDSFEAVASPGPSTSFDTSGVGREMQGARQMESFGESIRQNSLKLSKIEIDAQREANELRANDALNKARQRAIELTYNTDDGFSLLKGVDALERPDGKSLPDEYGSRFDEYVNEVSGELANDHQRQMFRQNAAQLSNSLRADASRHMLQEFTNYHGSVADGALKLSQQEAELAWNDPDRIDRAINGVEDPQTQERIGGIRQAIEQKARLTGMSATEVAAEVRTAESGVHSRVIQAALVNSNVAYADLYFKQNRKNMTGNDILSVKKVLDDQTELVAAQGAVDEAMRASTTAFLPSDISRLQNIVLGAESGGKRYGRDGKLLEGPLTKYNKNGQIAKPGEERVRAQGERQVMPYTAADPGYGVAPAKDDSPAELARVGRDYLTAMLREYGDVAKALAAYNAGPGVVDKAVKDAKKEGNPNAWISKMPAETRAYVKAGVDKFSAGGGATPMPTQLELTNTALAQLSEDAPPSTRDKVRQLAEKQYKLVTDARKQKSEQVLEEAQRALVENGGSFAELPANMKMDLLKYDPKVYEDAAKYADAVLKGEDVRTNDTAYIEALSNPGRLAAMGNAEFQQWVTTNFSQKDRDEIIKKRAGVLSGTDTQSTDRLDDKAVVDTTNQLIEDLGVSGWGGDKKKANILRGVRDDLYSQQKALGRRLTPKETEDRINFWFARTISTERGIFSDANNAASMYDMSFDEIPATIRDGIVQGMIARGVTKPREEDVLRAYWSLRLGNK